MTESILDRQSPSTDRPADSQPLYRQLADQYRRAIGNGVLRPGDRMPSMRAFMQRHGVSLATATESYRVLERAALIDARPRAGYFVRVPPSGRVAGRAEPDLACWRAPRSSSAFTRRFRRSCRNSSAIRMR